MRGFQWHRSTLPNNSADGYVSRRADAERGVISVTFRVSEETLTGRTWP